MNISSWANTVVKWRHVVITLQTCLVFIEPPRDVPVLQCVAVCCSVLQCVAVCCSVLQCVAVCCNVLQCVENMLCLYRAPTRRAPSTRVLKVCDQKYPYGVASSSRLLKIIGLFCKRALQKRRYSAKETYNFKEPTNRSHPILEFRTAGDGVMNEKWVMSHI